MKTKIYFLTTLLCTILFTTGCNDKYLDRPPLDSLNDANFWQEQETSIGASTACYDWINKSNTLDYEYLSDNNLYYSNTDYLENISAGFSTNYDGNAANLWAWGYGAIRRCNTFIENYQKGTYDPILKERLGAEVRFLRAYYYAQLITMFGDVPFITKTISPGDPEVYGKRNPKSVILDFVLKEFQDAADILPVSYSNPERGRATKGAALAMKSRYALYNGKYDIAEKAAADVMNLGYKLYDVGNTRINYYMLFRYSGKPSTNNANLEDIFWRPYLVNKVFHNLSRELQLPTTRPDEYIRWSPTKSLVDSYLCTDGLPIDKSPLYKGARSNDPGNATYEDYWRNRDPRMSQTILSPRKVVDEDALTTGKASGDLGYWLGNNKPFLGPSFPGSPNTTMTRTGFYFCKYAEIGGTPNGNANVSSNIALYNYDWNDIRIIRYAEVLLTYAEACLEQNKLTQGIVDVTINVLRKRVGMRDMNLIELQNAGIDARTEIRRERRVELALDGTRYFDILRWKLGSLLADDKKGMNKMLVEKQFPSQKVNTDINNTDVMGDLILFSGRIFNTNKHYLWPIPQSQIVLNSNLTQNPQW